MHPSAEQDLTTLVAGSMRFEWCLAVTLYLETQLVIFIDLDLIIEFLVGQVHPPYKYRATAD